MVRNLVFRLGLSGLAFRMEILAELAIFILMLEPAIFMVRRRIYGASLSPISKVRQVPVAFRASKVRKASKALRASKAHKAFREFRVKRATRLLQMLSAELLIVLHMTAKIRAFRSSIPILELFTSSCLTHPVTGQLA